MTIVFEAFSATEAEVTLRGLLGTVVSRQGNLVAIDGDLGVVNISAHLATSVVLNGDLGVVIANNIGSFGRIQGLLGVVYGASFTTPSISIGHIGGAYGRIICSGHVETHTSVVLQGDLGTVFSRHGSSAYLDGLLGRVVSSNYAPLAHSILIALQSPGYMSMAEGTILTMFFDDTANLTTTPLVLGSGISFDELLVGTDNAFSLQPLRRMLLSDAVAARDFTNLIAYVVCTSTANATTTITVYHNILLTLADVLMAADSTLTLRHALISIGALLAARDSLQSINVLHMADNAAATTALVELAGRIAEVINTAALTDLLTPQLHMFIALADKAAFTDSLLALRHALMALDDIAFLGGRFVFDGEAYTVYAVQPVGAAVSEYTNMQFDSMTTIDGVTYGVNELGVFTLEGPNDSGAPIRGSIYTGLTNFGESLIKEVPFVYVGLTKSGSLLLKATSTAKGLRKENWYQLSTKSIDAISNARFQLSKGLQAQYWGFELSNINGEDFDVEFVKAWVLTLNRRV